MQGEQLLQVPREESFHLQPVMKTIGRQTVPLQPMEVYGGADLHLQPIEDPTPEQVDVGEVLP